MPPRSYAAGPPHAATGRPRWLWRFDSKWLRDETVRRNAALLHPVAAPDVSNRARRATLDGAWVAVGRGIDACPFADAVEAGERPPLDLPVGPPRGGSRRAGWLVL